MIFNTDGIAPNDCYREAAALRARATEARAAGHHELALSLGQEANDNESFGDILAGITPLDHDEEPGPLVVDDDPSDDAVWWVLVDGHVFLNEPVAGSAEALRQHARTVEFLAGRGVGRQRISLVHVSRAYGRAHFMGS